MSRLIDADELLKEANKDGAYGYVDAKQIDEVPTVDAVKHGEWLDKSEGYYWFGKCSVCGTDFSIKDWYAGNMNYCPNCGAKMDGKEQSNE